jgi:3-oxoacyl-[acyl-carrier protein] reductase
MTEISFGFAGRTVIVTGAARGIGLAVAQRFRQAEAQVVMVDLDGDEVEAAADRIGAIGIGADVSDTTSVDGVVAAAVERTGRVDVLVNNAGLLRDRVLWKLTDDDWQQVLDVHTGGTFRFTRACVPHFRQQQYGRIVNVTSYTGLRGNRGQANYATAKAGIIGFTKTAAKELAGFGVTVNAVSPNAATRMTATIPEEKIPDVLGPIARFAEPAEIATAVCFLASEEAGYITGTVLPVDGGLSI